jgi:hypothetical protein
MRSPRQRPRIRAPAYSRRIECQSAQTSSRLCCNQVRSVSTTSLEAGERCVQEGTAGPATKEPRDGWRAPNIPKRDESNDEVQDRDECPPEPNSALGGPF